MIRAVVKAAAFVNEPANREEVIAILARPDRVGVDPDLIRRSLERRLRVSPGGDTRAHAKYLIIPKGEASRPDQRQAAWLYAHMVRWGQTGFSTALLETAKAAWRPDLYDDAMGVGSHASPSIDAVAAFSGPAFDERQIPAYLRSFAIGEKI